MIPSSATARVSADGQLLLRRSAQRSEHPKRQLKFIEGVTPIVGDLHESCFGPKQLENGPLGAARPAPARGSQLNNVKNIHAITGH